MMMVVVVVVMMVMMMTAAVQLPVSRLQPLAPLSSRPLVTLQQLLNLNAVAGVLPGHAEGAAAPDDEFGDRLNQIYERMTELGGSSAEVHPLFHLLPSLPPALPP